MSEKTLQMNNCKDSKFSNTSSSFFPKRSFNKAINLGILSNMNYCETMRLHESDNAAKEQINQYLRKSMKFYNKNIDDLQKEHFSKKFDGITLKTFKQVKQFNKNNQREIQNFTRDVDECKVENKLFLLNNEI